MAGQTPPAARPNSGTPLRRLDRPDPSHPRVGRYGAARLDEAFGQPASQRNGRASSNRGNRIRLTRSTPTHTGCGIENSIPQPTVFHHAWLWSGIDVERTAKPGREGCEGIEMLTGGGSNRAENRIGCAIGGEAEMGQLGRIENPLRSGELSFGDAARVDQSNYATSQVEPGRRCGRANGASHAHFIDARELRLDPRPTVRVMSKVTVAEPDRWRFQPPRNLAP